MTASPVRIDGWKAIAAHLRRSRNTVMRWAQNDDLPVRRVAGKKGASVWAYAHELDEWLTESESALDPPPDPVFTPPMHSASDFVPIALPFKARLTPVNLAVIAGALLAAVIVVGLVLSHASLMGARWSRALPAEPAVADLYLRARDDWSTRTPEGLNRALLELGEVTSRDPSFALGYTGLADVYIAAHDYAAMPGSIAFPKAVAAATAALAIDADNADANRVLGFVDYWQRHDIRAARDHFGRSLQADPGSAQTHLWFGNVLADIGAYDESLRQLKSARLLEPGSQLIELCYAWTSWLRGPGNPGAREIADVAARGGPSMAHRFLSQIFLSTGDVAAYLDQTRQLAVLMGDANAATYVAAERKAYRRGGDNAWLAFIAGRQPPTSFPGLSPADLSATLFSLKGRRDRLLLTLERANAAREHWITWRPDQLRYAKWRGDPEVIDALDRVSGRRFG